MYAYEHRQYGPWSFVCLVSALGAFGIVAYAVAYREARADIVFPAAFVGLLMLVIGALMSYLDVYDAGDGLAVRFGPIPLFGTSIPYDRIESVERARLSVLLHGYGVHGLPGFYVAFGIWGFGAVRVRLKERRGLTRVKTVIIGTDEPDALLEFLLRKVAQQPGQPRS